jgi:hypothetical protein
MRNTSLLGSSRLRLPMTFSDLAYKSLKTLPPQYTHPEMSVGIDGIFGLLQNAAD